MIDLIQDLLVKERDGIEVALEIIEYFKSEQIVNKNTPFTTVDYDYAIDSIVNKNSLCKIRGELCKIYGKKFEELEYLAEIKIQQQEDKEEYIKIIEEGVR